MPTEENGVFIYSKDETPPSLFADFPEVPVRSRFGFQIVAVDGKSYWEAATEEQYRASEAKRLGISPDKVLVTGPQCYNTAPNQCAGTCVVTNTMCVLVYNPSNGHYYCTCR